MIRLEPLHDRVVIKGAEETEETRSESAVKNMKGALGGANNIEVKPQVSSSVIARSVHI